MQPGRWLYWAPLATAGLHMVEEFVLPGGFMQWYRRARPGIRRSITPRFLATINVLLLILCYDVGALAGRPPGVLLWLVVSALLGANAIWHLAYSVGTRSYSPGLVTGMLLYVPMVVYGGIQFVASGQVSLPMAALALAVGSSYQIWANLLHRWRSRDREGA